MNTTKKNELISESNYKYVLCRFAEGMKHIKNNTSKRYGILVILLLVLLTDILIQRTFVDTIIGDTFKIIIHLLFFIIALIAVLCYILDCGTPLIAHYVHNNFARIGLTNAAYENTPFIKNQLLDKSFVWTLSPVTLKNPFGRTKKPPSKRRSIVMSLKSRKSTENRVFDFTPCRSNKV